MIDGVWSTVGSSNLDWRSFMDNDEVNAVILGRDFAAQMSAMFALDAFMPNEDRHIGNMLFVQTGPRLRALAFDWSRTRLFTPWPWPASSKSAVTWEWFKGLGLADGGAIDAHLQRISSITQLQVFDILQAAPHTWRDNLDIDAAAQWWHTNKETRTMDARKVLLP